MNVQARNPRASAAETERLLVHWPRVVTLAPEGWPRDFARSVSKQCNRRGWRPTEKQASILRRMVSELFTHGTADPDDFDLIDREDRDQARG